jgi:hypothetical protein
MALLIFTLVSLSMPERKRYLGFATVPARFPLKAPEKNALGGSEVLLTNLDFRNDRGSLHHTTLVVLQCRAVALNLS